MGTFPDGLERVPDRVEAPWLELGGREYPDELPGNTIAVGGKVGFAAGADEHDALVLRVFRRAAPFVGGGLDGFHRFRPERYPPLYARLGLGYVSQPVLMFTADVGAGRQRRRCLIRR